MRSNQRRWLSGAVVSFSALFIVGIAARATATDSSTARARPLPVFSDAGGGPGTGALSSASIAGAPSLLPRSSTAAVIVPPVSAQPTPPPLTETQETAAPTPTTTPTTTPLPNAATPPMPSPTAAATSPLTPPPPAVRSGADVSADQPVGDPLSISIPAIGVDSVLVGAGVLADGTVAVPPDPSIAGWFTGGPKPGERGPAVIMGHVDSKKSGPGVFYHLVDIPIGAAVTVQTTTTPQQFVVQSVQRFPKNAFPTEKVYGPVPQAALRLITCGGSFDRSIGHYRDNVVVFLVPAVS